MPDILRDPAVVPSVWKAGPPDHLMALGLDLGTRTGYSYCWFKPGEPFVPPPTNYGLGQWDLSVGDFDSGALRFLRLRQFLAVVKPNLIFFERVRYTPPPMEGGTIGAIMARAATSSEFFGALMATVGTWAQEHGVPAHGYPISVLKKRATNKGNANKVDMIHASNALLGGTVFDVERYESTGDDNTADSLWALIVGLEEHALGTLGSYATAGIPVGEPFDCGRPQQDHGVVAVDHQGSTQVPAAAPAPPVGADLAIPPARPAGVPVRRR